MSSSRGKVIRVSPEVHAELSKRRSEFRSWDAIVRCLLGMTPRKGQLPKLREVWLVRGSLHYFERLSAARGEAVKQAALSGLKKPEPPVKMREVL